MMIIAVGIAIGAAAPCANAVADCQSVASLCSPCMLTRIIGLVLAIRNRMAAAIVRANQLSISRLLAQYNVPAQRGQVAFSPRDSGGRLQTWSQYSQTTRSGNVSIGYKNNLNSCRVLVLYGHWSFCNIIKLRGFVFVKIDAIVVPVCRSECVPLRRYRPA